MPTFWPVAANQAAIELALRADRREEELNCSWAISHYDYGKAHEIAAALDRQDSAGPILVAWTKPFEMTSAGDVALIFDLSSLIDDDIGPAMQVWSKETTEDPSLWNRGFRIERMRLIGHSFLERHGKDILVVAQSLWPGKKSS